MKIALALLATSTAAVVLSVGPAMATALHAFTQITTQLQHAGLA